ncbi:unnamed protein product [Callosobruchus maculatus]|uniref:Uncharacterized protein n=1 Tax=Callosobruchus maculatus TaxID=64391 RepID=A0A653D6Y1_CALMS|nr:unnamed protein product [Callosobruchus maculatus]
MDRRGLIHFYCPWIPLYNRTVGRLSNTVDNTFDGILQQHRIYIRMCTYINSFFFFVYTCIVNVIFFSLHI